ncbi:MAG TPA: extracellular solute-binding protein, partial [Geminicoccaceae bacterium]|nr:extracellular solute-binding protein [Geminicoccaceae bacterium]
MRAVDRRTLLKGAAGGVFAGVTTFAARKAAAVREQKLVYWHLPTFTPEADDIVQAQFDEFRKMAGLKDYEAAFVPTPHSELTPRLSEALANGVPPDLVRFYQSEVHLQRARGHLLDVTDVIEGMHSRYGVFRSCVRALAHDGRYWGIPFAINPWPMHVRLDVLEEHGLDYPRTWDALVETCLRIQKPPLYGLGMDLGRTVDATGNIMQVCWSFGGVMFDAAGKPAFDHDGNVQGFAFIDAMYNKHGIIPKAAVSNTDVAWNNRAYQAGRAAFIINQGSVYPYLASEDPELLAKTGLFAMPVGPAGAINHIETWSFGLFRHTPYPELAKGLAEYFMDPARYNEVIVANKGRFVPVYPDLFDDPWWTERTELEEFYDIADTGVPISHRAPPSAVSAEVVASHVIPEALHRVLIDGVA